MSSDQPSGAAMHDARGRRIDYLRVSLTDRCNFRCIYCMPPEGVEKLRHDQMLTLEELADVIRLMVTRLGIAKVRVTGGEPLVRRGVLDFLQQLGRITGVQDLGLTTNGFHLAEMARFIREAGIRRLNVSLDTLQRERFKRITRVDGLDQVLAGIDAARQVGLAPIKINAVGLRETLDEVCDLIRFGIEHQVQVRFIELMPTHGSAGAAFVPNSEIRRAIEREYRLAPLPPSGPGMNGPPPGAARLYEIVGHGAICGFISPITQPFCATCNRIRLRGDGQLLPCLTMTQGYDLMPYVRPELRTEELVSHLRNLLPTCKLHTPARHEIRDMSRIGG